MATPIEKLVFLLDELVQLLSCTKDPYDVAIAKRLDWTRATRQRLVSSSSDVEMSEILQEIRVALRGGMGSFLDLYLYPHPDCGMSELEMNARFERLVNTIFSTAVQQLTNKDT